MSFRKEFRAPPLKHKDGKIIPFAARNRRQRARRAPGGWNWAATIVLAVAIGLIGAGLYVQFFDSGPPELPIANVRLPDAGPADSLSATFVRCGGPARMTCIVDGDTFWFEGDKYRIADINTPEISTPQCDRELELGERATDRLQVLLNAGPFSFRPGDEDTDRYGRKLRTVWRGGVSLGDVLVDEGLAERWQGFRGSWC